MVCKNPGLAAKVFNFRISCSTIPPYGVELYYARVESSQYFGLDKPEFKNNPRRTKTTPEYIALKLRPQQNTSDPSYLQFSVGVRVVISEVTRIIVVLKSNSKC